MTDFRDKNPLKSGAKRDKLMEKERSRVGKHSQEGNKEKGTFREDLNK